MEMVDNKISVNDELIHTVQLYIPRYWLFRYDVGPFIVYYVLCFAILLLPQVRHAIFSHEFETNKFIAEGYVYCLKFYLIA
jgi:hypothetical protein